MQRCRKEATAKNNLKNPSIRRIPRQLEVRGEFRESRVRAAIGKHRAWIEAKLGVKMENAVLVDADFGIEAYLIEGLFPDIDKWLPRGALSAYETLVDRIELPEGCYPVVRMRPEAGGGYHTREETHWWLRWKGVPAAVWLKGMEQPVILMPVSVMGNKDPFASDASEHEETFLLVRREDLGQFAALVGSFLSRDDGKKTIYVLNGGDISFKPCQGWEHLILDPKIVRLVRQDFERFFESRDWFLSRGIPFRRGYLLYGPPGNGKTSVVRAMASMPGLSACTLSWGKRGVDDDDLSRLFEWASDHAPALVIMEDIDRHFSRGANAEPKHNISLAHLLNCLDGIRENEGVVVVATANHPAHLDPAILSRPGRFDRVVEFPDPDEKLREQYLRQMLGFACSRKGLRQMVQLSAGFSFAQLREAYITAAYLAFDRKAEIDETHVAEALRQLAPALRKHSRSGRAVGFREAAA